MISPGIAVSVVLFFVKLIPTYAGFAISQVADRIQTELTSPFAEPIRASLPECIHPNATIHYHQSSLSVFESMIVGTAAGVTSAIMVRKWF